MGDRKKPARTHAAKKAETGYYKRAREGRSRLPGTYLTDSEAETMQALYEAHGGGKKQAILDAAAAFVKKNVRAP